MPALVRRGRKLFLGNCSLSALAKQFHVTGSSPQGPIYVYDAARIASNARRLRSAMSDSLRRFSTRVYFALKSNSNPSIVRLLRQQGLGADCCNMNEVRIARMAGVPASKILYSGNNNPMREIEEARRMGLAINFDDTNPFERSKFSPSDRSLVSFRYNPGVGLGENAKITTAGPDSKFGLDDENLMRAYRLAVRRGARRFGLHMMAGSNTLTPELFVRQVHRQLQMAGRLCRESNIRFEFIDIGGGFGVPYRPGHPALDIKKLGRRICGEYAAGCQRFGVRGPNHSWPDLAMEPGRFLVADAGVLLAQVTNVKHSFTRRIIGLEASMATLLRPAMYGSYHHIHFNGKEGGQKSNADVVGMACENSDYFARDRPLPARIAPGDLAVICTAGAYGYSMSSNYCNLPRPAEVLVENRKARIIRKRETFRELIR